MRGLEDILAEIEQDMDEKDAVREVAVKSTRALARLASAAIRGMHRGEDVEPTMASALEETHRLKAILAGHPDLYHSGLVENALQEVVEAAAVRALLRDEPLPSPRDLGATNAAYLLGLGDAIGELRRFALEALRRGDLDGAQGRLATMEELYDALLRFDYPTALVAVKRKQDVARSLIERTRGEIVVAARGIELERKLDALGKRL